jgi:hypothetical protein
VGCRSKGDFSPGVDQHSRFKLGRLPMCLVVVERVYFCECSMQNGRSTSQFATGGGMLVARALAAVVGFGAGGLVLDAHGVPAEASAKVLACYKAGNTTIQKLYDCAGVWVTPYALMNCTLGIECSFLQDTVDGRATVRRQRF